MDTPTAAPDTAPDTAPDSAPDSSPGSTTAESSPPETASPVQPTAADVPLLAFVQVLELTLRDLYDVALDAGVGHDELGAALATMRENHEEYANAMSGLLATAAPGRRDDGLYEERRSGFNTADLATVAAAAYEVESLAIASHIDVVGRLEGLVGAKTVTSLLMVESEHCTVLAHLAGRGDALDDLLVNAAETALPASITTAATLATTPATSEG